MTTELAEYTAQVADPKTIKALKPDPRDIGGGWSDRDEAGKGSFNIQALQQMLSDIDRQPTYWRDRADFAMGYIDGKQFTPMQERALRAEGLEDLRPTNLVARTIRSVCGQEAKSRSAVKIECDDDESQDVADVLNPAMVESRRESKADMAISAAYFHQTGCGIGWVKVDEDPDPLNYPDRVRQIDRRSVWWDFEALDPMLKDARWLVHKEWADLDELVAVMPQHAEVLRQTALGWQNFSFDSATDYNTREVSCFNDYEYYSRYRQRAEWYDLARKRIKMYEVWYRVPAVAIVLYLGPTRRVLYDPDNQSHVNAVVSGNCRIVKAPTSQVRCSLYAGPTRLQDVGTSRRAFPFVPFFAYRDDQDRTPYGLVEGMIGPQDEYNARRLRINWMLRARQIIMDNDALDVKANTLAQIADAIMRPDLTVILNANRTNKGEGAFRVASDLSLQKEQIDVMQDAKQLQDVPGVYGSQLGQAASGVTSGIANSLLIEQGAVAMGDLNDNYRDSRQLVHELLLDQIIARHKKGGLQVKVGRGNSRRVVVLNDTDEQGNIVNGVSDAAVRIGLGDAPNTPAYRMMAQQQMATVIQALAQTAPQAAAVMAPRFVETTDIPDRQEAADEIRHALNLPTASDKKQQQAQMAQQAQEAAAQKQIAQHAQTLSLEDAAAKIEKTKSETELNNAKVEEIGFEMGQGQVEAAHAMNEPARERQAEAENVAAQAQGEQQAAANDPAAEKTRRIQAALAAAQGQPA